MTTNDGPAALRRLAERIDPELEHGSLSTQDSDDMRVWADDWEALAAQAAADRAALAQARALLADLLAQADEAWAAIDHNYYEDLASRLGTATDAVRAWLGGAR